MDASRLLQRSLGRAPSKRATDMIPGWPATRRKRRLSWRPAGRRQWASRMQPWLIAGFSAVAGAGALFVFDPQSGRRRRARTRDRIVHLAHLASRTLRQAARTSSARLSGVRHRLFHALAGGPSAPADDRTLLDRIESQVFRDNEVPKGALNLNVVDGVAVLRGAVLEPALIQRFEERVRSVAGVRGVQNLMHLAGTDAPNKQAAIDASHAGIGGHRADGH